MLSSEFRALVKPFAVTLNVIFGAFVVAPVFYVIIARLVFRGGTDGRGPVPDVPVDPFLIQTALAVVAVALAATSFYYRRWALSDGTLRRKMEAMAGPDAAGGGFDAAKLAALAEGMRDLAPAEQRLATVYPHYQQTVIVTLAMREAIAIFGLVLTILLGDFATVLPWAAASMALMACQPPAVGTFMENSLRVARSF